MASIAFPLETGNHQRPDGDDGRLYSFPYATGNGEPLEVDAKLI